MLPKRPGDQLTTHANVNKARDVLGYNPHVSLEEGLNTMINWYLNEVKDVVEY